MYGGRGGGGSGSVEVLQAHNGHCIMSLSGPALARYSTVSMTPHGPCTCLLLVGLSEVTCLHGRQVGRKAR